MTPDQWIELTVGLATPVAVVLAAWLRWRRRGPDSDDDV
jgi:hypothetical protein